MRTSSVRGMEELQSCLLDEVAGIEEASAGKRTVQGSYSIVFDVKVKGVTCMARKLQNTSLEKGQVSAIEWENLADKFREECTTLSKLRHPNIVQFIGVHSGKKGLTLITEKLSSDLEEFMELHSNIVLPLKISILLDISYGLLYLHEYHPPVIHHELTARNILITERCQAKIADSSGVAKSVNCPEKRQSLLTPGAMLYMPPEAFTDEVSVTPKLDVFSFGHLSLYVSIQDTPKVYDSQDSSSNLHPVGEIELHRRRKPLRVLGRNHTLYPVVVKCLLDQPERRPTSKDINTELSSLARNNPCTLKDLMDLMLVYQPLSSRRKSLIRTFRSNTDPEVLDAKQSLGITSSQPLSDLQHQLSSEDQRSEDPASPEDLETQGPTNKEDIQHHSEGLVAENVRTMKTSTEQAEITKSIRESLHFSKYQYPVSQSDSSKSSNDWENNQTDLVQKAIKDTAENLIQQDDGSSQHIEKSEGDEKPCPFVATLGKPDDSSNKKPGPFVARAKISCSAVKTAGGADKESGKTGRVCTTCGRNFESVKAFWQHYSEGCSY